MTDAASDPLVSLTNLTVGYGGRRHPKIVLSDISLDIAAGEAIGIVGESGSGKTTLAQAILGTVDPLVGDIRFDGQPISHLRPSERRRFRRSGAVQYVFQDPLGSLDPQWTIFQSIEEGLQLQGERSRAVRAEAVHAAADKVHLDRALLAKLPGQLSGGQRQRAAIARALVGAPRLLIADEPVSALDAATRVQILELFAELRDRLRIGQIFISHDLGSVAFLVDRIAVLFEGRIVEIGKPAEIIHNPSHDYTSQLVKAVPRLRLAA